ncbi:hypothetical protein Mapa_003582 [Marchantia paleacea]|nr:hypothetical protein Mapa_003582 [Marchantia paleacea]
MSNVVNLCCITAIVAIAYRFKPEQLEYQNDHGAGDPGSRTRPPGGWPATAKPAMVQAELDS